MPDDSLLQSALESLERTGCQFFACDGPTLEPIDMATCHRCATVAQLRQRLALPIIHLEETTEYADALRLREEASWGHHTITISSALMIVRNRALLDEFGGDPDRLVHNPV